MVPLRPEIRGTLSPTRFGSRRAGPAPPGWTGEQLKAALVGTARPAEGQSVFEQGTGRLDVAAAIEQTVIAETPSLNLGTIAWPHGDDAPVSREVTYRNLGTEDVTLALDVTGYGPQGSAAPEGMFAVDAAEVTVPAGGTATVPLTTAPPPAATSTATTPSSSRPPARAARRSAPPAPSTASRRCTT